MKPLTAFSCGICLLRKMLKCHSLRNVQNSPTLKKKDMWHGGGKIRFGIYACSPEDSSFKATFTNMAMTQCQWLAHNGQAPDEEG